jgi:hypothetical protein
LDPEVLRSVRAIEANSKELASAARAQAVDSRIVDAIRSAAQSINDQTERAATGAHTDIGNLRTKIGGVQSLAESVDSKVTALQPLIGKIEALQADVDTRAEATAEALDQIKGRETAQAEVVEQTLAQRGEADGRGFFKRWFPPAVYKVGPLVPAEMSARLEQTGSATAEEKTAMDQALKAMAIGKPKPLGRKDFEASLRARLGASLKPTEVEDLIDHHLAAVLRVCRLPR